ncbi:MAG: trypsin-like peptidase domain-containing protein [Pseudomonadota bacterium]
MNPKIKITAGPMLCKRAEPSVHFGGPPNGLVRKERPVRPGNSISIAGGEAGTATVMVKQLGANDGATYLLSCEHVLKPNNQEAASILQPALQDATGTGNLNRIGNKVTVAGLSEFKSNQIDAAIVQLNSGIKGQNLTSEGNWPIFSVDRNYDDGMPVTMVGRSSGQVEGMIVNASVDQEMDYSELGWLKPIYFSGIAQCDYPCQPGDSGAPVLNSATGSLVGIHMAGGSDEVGNSFGFFCPAWQVFDQLHLQLI